ncbi:hypothetical protein TNCV_3622111 [Trichonephila clavipes]|nr:hypothetical protein TNCV_3622111 [Trichonephila clavipes]
MGGGQYLCSHPTQSETCCGRGSSAFLPGAYFSNDRVGIAVQRAFHLHSVIASRGHVPDQKCAFMRTDAFAATDNVSKERKEPPTSTGISKNVERARVIIQAGM